MPLERLLEKHTGFTLTPWQSSRHVATYITDTDFADDPALISDYLEEAQLFLLRLEVAASSINSSSDRLTMCTRTKRTTLTQRCFSD